MAHRPPPLAVIVCYRAFLIRFKMKAKVLLCYYSDGSGYQVVRVYMKKDFEQAKKDYEMMCQFASDCRTWKLEDVDMFGGVS